MKKIILVLFVVASAQLSMAQVGIGIGLKGGLNVPFGGVESKALSNSTTSNSVNFHAGAFAKFKFTALAIQVEALYSGQSSEQEGLITDGTSSIKSTLTTKVSYLTIPVVARYYLPGGLINFQAGPQFGLPLSAESEFSATGVPTTTTDIKSKLNTDIAITAGVGVDLPFGLDIHARYNIGLNDISSDEGISSSKNSMLQISVGYSLFKFND